MMAAARHMHVYGTTRHQLAAVAVAAREWARINPDAGTQDALDLDAVATAPTIADPLSKLRLAASFPMGEGP